MGKKFKPMDGCAGKCPIEQDIKEKKSEICCFAARQCCFYCFEDDCPIQEIYKDIIKKYQ